MTIRLQCRSSWWAAITTHPSTIWARTARPPALTWNWPLRRSGGWATGVKFVTIDWEKKKELVENGTIDCIWGSFSMDGREEEYQWAGPYLYSRQVVAVRSDSDIRTLQDLTGKVVVVQSTTKPEELFLNAEQKLRSVNAQIEYLLRDALRKAGRLKPAQPEAMDDDE